MSKTLAKRFYKNVAIEPKHMGFVVTLDGRVLKTPGKKPLLIPLKPQAKLVAKEWDAQKAEINPAMMPLTRLMNVACERTPENREALIEEVRRYGGSDLLCYRAESPRELIESQKQKWGRWLKWADKKNISLRVTTGIIAVEQDEQALAAITNWVRKFDDIDLTLVVHFTAVFGSVILALAVMRGGLDAGDAFDLSRLDALYQIERWGEDEEAAEIAMATRQEIIAIAKLIRSKSTGN